MCLECDLAGPGRHHGTAIMGLLMAVEIAEFVLTSYLHYAN